MSKLERELNKKKKKLTANMKSKLVESYSKDGSLMKRMTSRHMEEERKGNLAC